MSQAGQNLKYLRKQKGFTQEEMAEELGIKRSLVGAYEEERAEPRLEVMQLICDMFKLSLEDFLFKDLSESKLGYLQKRRMSKLGEDRKGVIHLVPVKAAAGYMSGYSDPAFIDELNTFTLPMLSPGNYRAFEIIGDSMLPTPSGSIIVGEKVDDVEDIKANDTYIVVSKSEGIVYKRVEKTGRSKKQITLVSDNPAYAPYNVNAEDVAEFWKTQFVISKPAGRPNFDVNHLANVVNTLQNHVTNLQGRMG
ncbi:MAG: LexA family transcriptional regulator [Chitinophagaceae bacterium]